MTEDEGRRVAEIVGREFDPAHHVRREEKGYVYVISSACAWPAVKIGCAASIPSRLKSLGTGSPREFVLLGHVEVADTRTARQRERKAHDLLRMLKFDVFGISGGSEWFGPPALMTPGCDLHHAIQCALPDITWDHEAVRRLAREAGLWRMYAADAESRRTTGKALLGEGEE